MKDRSIALHSNTIKCLLAIALCLSMSPAVWADDAPLLPEAGTIDNTPATSHDKPTLNTSSAAPSEPTVLQGGVRKHLHPQDATASPQQNPSLQGGATDNGADLKSAQGTIDPEAAYNLAAQKLASGAQMSSDQYRALGAGCVGYESDRTFFQDIAKVSIVYKDSPADKAGIKKGDKLIDHENDDAALANPSQPRQQIQFDRVGTPVNITLLRKGQKVPMTLIRMNIEDIQEPDIRREWEKIIRKLGSPTAGSFSGTSLKNLTRDD